MRTTITVLPVSEMKIIKQINLVIQNRNEIDITAGIILYEREFSQTYKFKEKAKEKRDNSHFTRYPKQEDYPNDNLDLLILQAVMSEFSLAEVKNDLLFASSDVEHYTNLTIRPSEKAELNFIPDFSGIDLERLPRKSFPGFRKQISIYANGNTEVIRNRVFKGYCHFENYEDIYDKLERIKFL